MIRNVPCVGTILDTLYSIPSRIYNNILGNQQPGNGGTDRIPDVGTKDNNSPTSSGSITPTNSYSSFSSIKVEDLYRISIIY